MGFIVFKIMTAKIEVQINEAPQVVPIRNANPRQRILVVVEDDVDIHAG